MEKKILHRNDLVYPELSYKIVGILYEVYNNLGYGLSEKTYQKATAEGMKDADMEFSQQVYFPILYKGKKIGSNYLDFLIEKKVVLELKKGDRFAKAHIDQIYQYLVVSKLKLGILAYFAPRNVHFKRIVNLY